MLRIAWTTRVERPRCAFDEIRFKWKAAEESATQHSEPELAENRVV